MQRRNKIAALLVMPIAVVLWLIGWGLTIIGSKHKITKIKTPIPLKQENLGFAILPPEQKAVNE